MAFTSDSNEFLRQMPDLVKGEEDERETMKGCKERAKGEKDWAYPPLSFQAWWRREFCLKICSWLFQCCSPLSNTLSCLTNNSPTSVDIKVFSFCYIREQKRILYNLYDNILVGVLVNPLVHKSISLQFINHFYISFD